MAGSSPVPVRIGVDVGGTNTDAVVVQGSGDVVAWSKATTTQDVVAGVAAAVGQALHAATREPSAREPTCPRRQAAG